tara:strand:+ start:5945 stop:6301 length:357 start_codon:yes stop_codon:yes gene_type:complete
MKFSFKNETLFFKEKLIHTFIAPISDLLEFEECIVVLLCRDYYKKDNENVFCLDTDGVIKWQVPKYDYIYDRSPFVGIDKEGDNVKLYNWDSSYVIIEPTTGKVIVDAFQSRKGRRPW